MQQIKIFKSLESDLAGLEREVNQWLAETKARVVSVFGNIAPQTPPAASAETPTGTYITKSPYAPSDVMIVILYELEA